MNKGQVGILNVGAGDTKLSFDPNNPAECIRAARIVTDMLRRGYALLVEVEREGKKAYRRVHKFDEKTFEYIIADFDPIEAAAHDSTEKPHGQGSTIEKVAPATGTGKRSRGRPRATLRVEAGKSKAVAVARTAGG